VLLFVSHRRARVRRYPLNALFSTPFLIVQSTRPHASFLPYPYHVLPFMSFVHSFYFHFLPFLLITPIFLEQYPITSAQPNSATNGQHNDSRDHKHKRSDSLVDLDRCGIGQKVGTIWEERPRIKIVLLCEASGAKMKTGSGSVYISTYSL